MLDEDNSLAWDYTADEAGLTVASGSRLHPPKRPPPSHVLLSRRYVVRLLESLDAAGGVLAAALTPRGGAPGQGQGQGVLSSIGRRLSANILLVTLVLHIGLITVLSVMDVSGVDPAKMTRATVVALSCVGVCNMVVVVWSHGLLMASYRQHAVRTAHLVQLHLAAILLTASAYTASYIAAPAGWSLSAGADSATLYAEKYAMFLTAAMTYGLPLGGSTLLVPVSWYNCLLTSLQMTVCFIYLVLIVQNMLHPSVLQRVQPKIKPRNPFQESAHASLDKYHKSTPYREERLQTHSSSLSADPQAFLVQSSDTAYTTDSAYVERLHKKTLSSMASTSYKTAISGSQDSLLMSLEQSSEALKKSESKDRCVSVIVISVTD